MYRFVVLLLFLLILAGCGDVGVSGRELLTIQTQIFDDNPDADKAASCIFDFGRKEGTYNGTQKDVIVLEVDRDCLKDIIESKKPEEPEE